MRMQRTTWTAVTLLCATVFFVPSSGQGEIPPKIDYQLRLTDLSGEPLFGPHTVTYRIFDAATDGNLLWTETQNEMADESGIISTILGSRSILAVAFDGPRWLEVIVDGETLLPRREIVSSAYAFHAADSDHLGGAPSGSYSRVGHTHGDQYVVAGQPDAVNSSMIEDGTIRQDDVSNGYVDRHTYQVVNAGKQFRGPLRGDRFHVEDAGDNNAVIVTNTSNTYPTVYSEQYGDGVGLFSKSAGSNAILTQNTSYMYPTIYALNNSGSPAYVTGIYGWVPTTSFFGIGTNGRGFFGGGVFASIESTRGEVLMTSPLTREQEVYLSGSGSLVGGKARISLDSDIAGVIAPSEPIRVIVTATELCNGLAVIQKDTEGFTVRELAEGTSNSAFDWLVVARRVAAPGTRDAAEMPSVVPTAAAGEARTTPVSGE